MYVWPQPWHPTQVRKEIERAVRLLRRQLPAVREAAEEVGALSEVVRAISEIVETQCQRQLDQAPRIRKMMTIV